MSVGIPRIYTSFAEFEREELRRLESMGASVDDMVEERFAEELDFSSEGDQPTPAGASAQEPALTHATHRLPQRTRSFRMRECSRLD